MKKRKTEISLLNKKRFEVWEREEKSALRKMSIKESIRTMESLLDSGLIDEFKRIQKELGTEECQKG